MFVVVFGGAGPGQLVPPVPRNGLRPHIGRRATTVVATVVAGKKTVPSCIGIRPTFTSWTPESHGGFRWSSCNGPCFPLSLTTPVG